MMPRFHSRLLSLAALLALSTTLPAYAVAHGDEDHGSPAKDKGDTTAQRMFSRDEIRQIVIDTIMEEPEVMIKSIEVMQEKKMAEEEDQARQAIQAYSTTLFEDTATPMAGNPKGDVTVVEFFDYNCGYCKRSLATVREVMEQDKNVKFLFKDYPIIAMTSEKGAKASLAFHMLKPAKFMEFHAALFGMGGKFSNDNLVSVATDLGVDEDEFLEKMESREVAEAIDRNRELATKMGARGVPMFVVGDTVLPGAVSTDTLMFEINRVREAAKAEDKQ